MKVKLQDEKQVDEAKATVVSSNLPYILSYRTNSKSVEPNYIASYTDTKHNHHRQKLTQPYTASYTHSHELNHPYITAYGVDKTPKESHNSDVSLSTTSYGDITHSNELNLPYIATYDAKKASKESQNDDAILSYVTKYGGAAPAQEANRPYITAYKKVLKESPVVDLTVPYITGYKKVLKESTNVDPTLPYITGYKKVPKESSDVDHIVPYITGYKKVSKESPDVDSIVSYITQYGGTIHANEANHPYITAYGSKKLPKQSSYDDTSKPYITYGGTDPKPDLKKSSSLDHTEAFKAGFFALNDLYVGNVMTLQFPIEEVSHFLPRKEADSIPFSSSQLPSVLQLFSILEDSPEAVAMRGTLEQCEGEPITGETKICATSLESMLEFVSTTIGSETKHNLLTTSLPTISGVPLQKFTILDVSEDIDAPKWVACHPLTYPYAIHYCHFIATGSKVFKVSLGSENGENKVEALGICHLDTSDWDPNHILFRQLGIKAGQDPVCHFFPVKHLLWIPQPSQATM
ncbi:hypothetical protein LR48_Vigan08g170800 [Vigna angularis]|nr:BURP domain-containing protein [Vigna angularis]KOM50881.1 hypothetical protein LR48_Vigan08g170800 [Vigna angularis]